VGIVFRGSLKFPVTSGSDCFAPGSFKTRQLECLKLTFLFYVNLIIRDCYLNMGDGYLRSSVHLSFRPFSFKYRLNANAPLHHRLCIFDFHIQQKFTHAFTKVQNYRLSFLSPHLQGQDASTLPPSHNMLSSITSTVGRKVNVTKLFSTMTKLVSINFFGAVNHTARSIPAAQAASTRSCPTCLS
jgi:hypothetical protein